MTLTDFLDWWLGPRSARVVRVRDRDNNTGWTFIATDGARIRGEVVIRDGLRWGAAVRMARRLREQAENTVEAV